MPGNSQQTILAAFNQASGNPAGSTSAADPSAGLLPAAEQSLIDTLSQAAQVINAQTQATSANTEALALNSQTRSAGSAASDVAGAFHTASQILGGGFSLMPLVSLISSLFGGGDATQPTPLSPFLLPPALSLESTTSYQNVSWGENGLPRPAGSSVPNAPAQITVQVQALDSQSFLDHSDEIARAVRQAMLNMNSLNDLVTSL